MGSLLYLAATASIVVAVLGEPEYRGPVTAVFTLALFTALFLWCRKD